MSEAQHQGGNAPRRGDMTINEIKQLRDILEMQIRDLVNEFVKDTGVNVDRVDLITERTAAGTNVVARVHVDISL